MKALGVNISNIENKAAASVNENAGKTLFGNNVGIAEGGEFANLMDIIGGSKSKAQKVDLLSILNSAKQNPEALNELPKEVLQLIGENFQFDGKAILNQNGKPIQVEDIINKINEMKPELLNQGASKEADLMEVRNLLKGHNLDAASATKKSHSLFTSGNDFVQAKGSAQPALVNANASDVNGVKKMNGLNQYSKESQNLDTALISNSNVEIPEAAVGMTQFKNESAFDQLGAQSKVIDLSNVQAGDKNSLIDQVSKLIEQNNIKSADTMDVTVKHDDLGQFKIEVSKNANSGELDVRIISKERAGHNFFVENEAQLAKSLNQSGIKLANIKVSLSSENVFTSNADTGKDSSESFSQNSKNQNGQYGQRDNENSDSQRRKHLWQAFKQNAEYASA
ncbi:MAG: hypothetical protein ACJAT2_001086 [Bacteriovoracaceae bacterium]|jgi:hypothetical protein